MLIKLGENFNFGPNNILEPKQALGDEEIAKRFIKLAKKLKKLAPRAKDFLYGHAIMMHAAEASLVDQNTGESLKNSAGDPVKGYFEYFKNSKGQDSVKWISPDGIKPYKNHNGDIFGEDSLLKAYKRWVGKPLCKDHKSDSVDGIRGIIIDTYYDPKFKRVHALFALDKVNYADLARKVETGYANSVSMGTGVGRSVCTECHNVALTERDYCSCIKSRRNYGEINLDLSPIELSLVVNGADGLAKIRKIIASVNEYINKKQVRIDEIKSDRCVNPTELQSLADTISDMQKKLKALMPIEKSAMDEGELIAAMRQLQDETDPEMRDLLEDMIKKEKDKRLSERKSPEVEPVRSTTGGGHEYTTPEWAEYTGAFDPSQRLASIEGGEQGALNDEISLLRSKIARVEESLRELKLTNLEENNMNSARLKARARARRAYFLGGGGVNEPTPGKPKYEKEDSDSIRDKEDKQMVGEPLETGNEGLHPGDLETKKKLLRAEDLESRKMKREALLEGNESLEDRAMKRRAYWLGGGGVNEPTPGKPKYEKEDSDSIRDKEDKQMVGQPLDTGSDGLHPGDLETKKKLLRAKMRATFTKVADSSGNINKSASKWDFYAGDRLVLTATGKEIYDDEIEDNWNYLKSEEYAHDVMRHIREEGLERTAYLLKGAQDPVAPAPMTPEVPAAPAPEMPPLPEAAPVSEPGKDVSVKETKSATQEKVDKALSAMEEKLSEIRSLMSGAGSEELVDINVNIEGKEEKGSEPSAEKAPPALEGLLASKDELMKVEALMDMSADELAEVSDVLENMDKVAEGKHGEVLKFAGQALADSDLILKKAGEILGNTKTSKKDVKESKAQKLLDEALKVRAENRLALISKAEMMSEMYLDEELPYFDEESHVEEGLDEEEEMFVLSPEQEDSLKKLLDQEKAEGHQLAKDKDEDDEDEDEKDEDDEDDEDEDKDDEDESEDEKDAKDMYLRDECPSCDDSVLASRKSERNSIVAMAAEKILGKYELDLGVAQNATERTYFEAHPGGKGTMTELTHTKTPEAKVETISEVHDKMREVAESGPRNVREAAALIQESIVKGVFAAEDVDGLVARGKVDSTAASYWKQYFSQAPNAGSFGADMSKEFETKKKEADNKDYKLKLRRAYDIGLQAQDKGLVGETREALQEYVDEIMSFDDASFESTKRVVSSYKADRHTMSLPRVGAEASARSIESIASVEPVDADDQLLSLWK